MPAFVGAVNPGGGNPSPGGTNPSGGNQPPAQTTTTIKPVINNPLNRSLSSGGIPGIINAVMRGVVMPLASILVVLAILYSGFKFVIAQGNATEIQKARDGLVWVLIGSAVLLGAYGISEFIQGTINQIVTTSV